MQAGRGRRSFSMSYETIFLCLVYLFPIALSIVIAKKILHREEINSVDILLAIYTAIWILILISIGVYFIQYYAYIKKLLGIREEYIWILIAIVLFLLIYNFRLWWKISKSKRRELDKW
jgi:hypothetical protein